MTLLGVRTLEGFGVMVDNIGHRFVATTTIVAFAGAETAGFCIVRGFHNVPPGKLQRRS